MDTRDKIIQARKDILYSEPDEMKNVLARRDMNQPLGCMYFASGSAKQFSDLLYDFRVALEQGELSLSTLKQILSAFLPHLENELGGMYGLHDCEAVVHCVMVELSDCSKESLIELLDALIAYLKRLHIWLDLYVPWEKMNEQIRLGLVP